MNKVDLTIGDAIHILETVSKFQLSAEKVERYKGNPYVYGDNVAEHVARTVRLAIYTMPFLKAEFAEYEGIEHLAEDVYVTVLTHDDEEVAEGFDIRTTVKNHNSRIYEEIESVKSWIKDLPENVQEYIIRKFSSFRKRDTLVSKIAKVFDNITGSQLVLEQKLGMVAPDSARFAIFYVESLRNVSKTTDLLIDAFVKQILDYRELAKNNESEIDFLVDLASKQEGNKLSKGDLRLLIKKLLYIDILNLQVDKSKTDLFIWQYQ